MFADAYKETIASEGGYSSDPVDLGGETYTGISRKYNPDWQGWAVVDRLKLLPGFPVSLEGNPDLESMVTLFYRAEYWDKLLGGSIAEISPEIANEMFDTGVNMSRSRAVRFLQSGLNALNREGKIYDNLEVDGAIGRKTIAALRHLPRKDHGILLKMLNVMQGAHYLNRMEENETQERFARGWFSRVQISK